MKSVRPLIVALGLLIATSARAGTLDLGTGTIDLPPGTHMRPGHGLDSAIGSLVSSDGTPEVGYDIGGQFDAPTLPRKELTFYRHGTTNGVSWVAYRTKNMSPYSLSVWYPKPLATIFGARCTNSAERLKALRLIMRYKPKKLVFDENGGHEIP